MLCSAQGESPAIASATSSAVTEIPLPPLITRVA